MQGPGGYEALRGSVDLRSARGADRHRLGTVTIAETTGHDAETVGHDAPKCAVIIGRNVRSRSRNRRSRWAEIRTQGLRRAVVVGAGDQARRLLETMRPESGWQVLALYDEDPATRGLRIAGVPVRGNLQALQHTDECRKADYVIVAVPAAQAPAYARAMEAAYQTGKTVVPLDPSWQEPQRPPVLA
jgi:FlaA1/EpsC-like NDP-sugar epimerase